VDKQSVNKDSAVIEKSPNKTVRRISITVAILVAVFGVVLATRKPASEQTVASPLISRPAPAIIGTTLTGQQVSLANYAGRFVLVNFFASWCTACQTEEKGLVGFAAKHRKAGDASVLGVIYDDTNSSAQAFLNRYGATYNAAVDPKGRIALEYGVNGIPQSYLIAPNGTILTEIIGPVNQISLDQLINIAKSRGF